MKGKRPLPNKLLTTLLLQDEGHRGLENGYVSDVAAMRHKVMERINILIHFSLQGLYVLWFEMDLYQITDLVFEGETILLAAFVLSFFYLILRAYEHKTNFDRKLLVQAVGPNHSFWSADTRSKLLTDLVLTWLVPNYFLARTSFVLLIWVPDTNSYIPISYNHILMALSLLRTIFMNPLRLLNFLFTFCEPGNQRILRIHGSEDEAMKVGYFIEENPFKAVMILIIVNITVFSYIIRILEAQNPVYDFENLYNSVWFTVVTMGTVGYGDYTPSTVVSRMLSLLICLVGVIQSYLVTVILIDKVSLVSWEKMALDAFDKQEIREKLMKNALEVIKNLQKVNFYTRQPNTFVNSIISSIKMNNVYFYKRKMSRYTFALREQTESSYSQMNKLMKTTKLNLEASIEFKGKIKQTLDDLEKLSFERQISK